MAAAAATMDSCPRASSPLTPAERLGVGDFLPFDREPRMDDTAEFLERCSLDYGQPGKINVVSGQRTALSQCSGECELDGSYSEYIETQWVRGSGSEGEQESSFGHEGVDDVAHDIGSDTESVVVSAPLHGPTTVRCVCVCKKRGCKFVKKPFDAQSIRESPISKMPVRYRMVTWLTALRPQRRADSPAADQMDAGAKVHPEKKSKIIQMFRSRRFRRTVTTTKAEASSPVETIRKHFPGVDGLRKGGEPSEGRRCRGCQVSVMRSLMVLVGLSLITLGVTYDYGVKHGVDSILQSCWSWLRTSYMNFGDEFVSYNSLFFRMNNNEALYGEPYPKYGTNNTKKSTSNGTRFKDAINKVDPKFLFVLEGLKLSVQLHFFSIDENSDMTTPHVLVHDRGPLFFRISFRRTAGLYVDYLPERSNMSLSTPFLIYDLMKMILLTNEFPYFGMHMHDYLKTTPSALFNMIIDNLKKFNVDTTFLSSIQAQIQKGRRKRSPEREKFRVHVPVVPPPGGTEPTVGAAGASTVPPVHVTATRTATEQVVERQLNASDRAPGVTTFERLRRSTEEPSRRKSAWKSLSEISRKIFLPLPLDTKKTVLLPVPFIERNLTLRYRHAVNVLGLPGYQFILGNDITKSGIWEHSHQDLYPSLSYSRVKDGEQDASNPHIQRHRYNEKRKFQHHRHTKHQNPLESDSYRKSFNDVLGVVDLEPLMLDTIGRVLLMGRHLEHYPFWISPPHFLSLADHIDKSKYSQESWNTTGSKVSVVQSDPSNTNLVVGVEGVSANESIHGSFIYYHPILGVPINASLAVQVGVRPPEGMLHAHKLVPIMWTRVQVEEIPLTLWYILWAACHLRETIMVCLISTGILVVTCALTCSRKKRLLQRPDMTPVVTPEKHPLDALRFLAIPVAVGVLVALVVYSCVGKRDACNLSRW